MNSASVCTRARSAKAGDTTTTLGTLATRDTGVKSATAS